MRFGVTLERLQPRYLEIVRQWRNSGWVRPYMRQRAVVGVEDQARWFAGLDADRDWYFTAHVKQAPFALFHVKNVNPAVRCGEAGGFVGAPEFIGRPEPAQATMALMDFAFLVLQLDTLEAQYSRQLPRIGRFNEQLGYEVFREEADGFVRARVTLERYLTCAASFRSAAAKLHGSAAILASPEPGLAPLMQGPSVRAHTDLQLELR
jgi:RimJ/RimL family protein N-acetyltransferase